MRKLVLIVSILALYAVSFAAKNDDQHEFAGIPFGMAREQVVEEIIKLGYEPYGTAESSDRIVIPVYMMGDLPVQVDFLFNRNDKFYSFEIRTGRIEERRLPKIFEAIDYMGEQFSLKYGTPGQEPPNWTGSDIHSGTNLYQEWFGVRTLNVSTAIICKDGLFYTVGMVTHRTLAKETESAKKAVNTGAKAKAAF